MSATRPQLLKIAMTGEVPSGDGTAPPNGFRARVRDAVIERRPRLEEHNPEAVDLTTDVLVMLHRLFAGSVEALAGDRPGDVMRRIFRGESYSLTLEDIARLAIEAPQKTATGLALLLARTGHTVAPLDGPPLTATETTAQVASRSGDLVAALTRALANDGRIDSAEARELLPKKAALARLLSRIDAIAAGTGRE